MYNHWGLTDPFLNLYNMKELKVTPPKGYIIDEEKSTIYNIVFKKKDELPTTWEEFCKQNPSTKGEYFIGVASGIVKYISNNRLPRDKDYDKLLFSIKKDAEAHLTLIQLHRLRDVYRQGWVPDYKDVFADKYSIVWEDNILTIVKNKIINHFLTFQSEEIAKQFLKNFKDLIEKAQDLI